VPRPVAGSGPRHGIGAPHMLFLSPLGKTNSAGLN